MRISDWSSDVCSSDLGVRVAAGTPLMMLNGAANRDPRRFECPEELRLDRANAQSHIAFGRGAHACPGGPLARAEGRISLERILERTGKLHLPRSDERRVGKEGGRTCRDRVSP